jgi:hypothetical protein
MVEAPEEGECEAVVERLVGIARSELA